MTMSDELRKLTATRADAVTLYERALADGFSPMRNDALGKVRLGLTDEAEVFRVLH
jgi:type II secretory ATPase GspE/PulE/Tfp pilus assembly ATPase PilB-like protein